MIKLHIGCVDGFFQIYIFSFLMYLITFEHAITGEKCSAGIHSFEANM